MLRTLELDLDLDLELVRALRVSASKPQSHQQDKHESSRGHQQKVAFNMASDHTNGLRQSAIAIISLGSLQSRFMALGSAT